MTDHVKRVKILGIPIDIVTDKQLPEVVKALSNNKEHRQIVLLDFNEMMRARFMKERRACLQSAALVIPVSRQITAAAGFLGRQIPPLRHSYPFIIQLLGLLEENNRSIYMLGSTSRRLRKAEDSVRATFPGLQIIGRYIAKMPDDMEANVVMAIRKASPALLLAGKGLKGGHLWLARHRKRLSPGLSVWENSCFDVFSNHRNKPRTDSPALLLKGFFRSLIRPWRFFRLFRYIYFGILLIIARVLGR